MVGMHRRIGWSALLALMLVLLLAPQQPLIAQEPAPVASTPDFFPGRVLVKFREDVAVESAMAALVRYDARRVDHVAELGVDVLEVPLGRELEISRALNQESGVIYAEPDYLIHAAVIPNDPYYGSQWALPKIHAPEAWDITTGAVDIVIAVIDTGVDMLHPDLAGKLVAGKDFIDNDTDVRDGNGHGTHVSGAAAAMTNNAVGVAGVSWGARIMPIRVLDDVGSGTALNASQGINFAVDNGAKIINLSWTASDYSATLENALANAYTHGALVVAALGNDRLNTGTTLVYPAAYPNVFAVAATDRDDNLAYYSNYGALCDVAAPGGETTVLANGIYSTMTTYDSYMTIHYSSITKNYAYLQGTSQATPIVAGLAALVWSLDPALTADEVQLIIQHSADSVLSTSTCAYGRINALNAVNSIALPATPVLNPIANADLNDQYTVSWNAVSAAVGYLLEESSKTDFSVVTRQFVVIAPATSILITGRPPGYWYYRVSAYNTRGYSGWSNVQRAGVAPPAPAINPIVNAGAPDAYDLGWLAATGADGYRLVEDDNATFTTPVVRYQGTSQAYSVTGQPGGSWYYRVLAFNEVGDGPWSTAVMTTVAPSLVAAPVLQPILNADKDGVYDVHWSDVLSATAYSLEDSLTPYFEAPRLVYTGDATLLPVVDQPAGSWYYRVRAHTPAGSSPWSAPQSTAVTGYLYLPLVSLKYSVSALLNGDFESGPVAWDETSTLGYPLVVEYPDFTSMQPHGGTWLAWLGGGHNEHSVLAQTIRVGTTAPYLIYWYRISSLETACGSDTVAVKADGLALNTYDLCVATGTTGWVEEVVDLRAYAGKPVLLAFDGATDSSLLSNFYVDDVSMAASIAAAPAAEDRDSPAVLESKED